MKPNRNAKHTMHCGPFKRVLMLEIPLFTPPPHQCISIFFFIDIEIVDKCPFLISVKAKDV